MFIYCLFRHETFKKDPEPAMKKISDHAHFIATTPPLDRCVPSLRKYSTLLRTYLRAAYVYARREGTDFVLSNSKRRLSMTVQATRPHCTYYAPSSRKKPYELLELESESDVGKSSRTNSLISKGASNIS